MTQHVAVGPLLAVADEETFTGWTGDRGNPLANPFGARARRLPLTVERITAGHQWSLR